MDRGAKTADIIGIIILFIALSVFYYWKVLPFSPGLLHNYGDQLGHAVILAWNGWALIR